MKVQRLSSNGVHSSEWKRSASDKDDDIVYSAWKHAAAIIGGNELTTHCEYKVLYGLGKKNLAIQLGVGVKEAGKVLEQYHDRIPYAKDLLWNVSDTANKRGYVKTILGRRRRFELWEPRRWTVGAFPLPLGEAQEKYGSSIRRGYTYKALNAVIQGGAADLMKKAMVDIYKSGVCDEIGVPLFTIHDELAFSHPKEAIPHLSKMKSLMENAIQFRVPILADMKTGMNWYETH